MKPSATKQAGRDWQLRPACQGDAADIARLFLISSDGLAAYIWERDRAPDVDLMAHGAARYRRRNTAFSFENCRVAVAGGAVIGMLHAFEMPEDDAVEKDPVLRPYSQLEDPGSLYVSGIAIDAGWRGRGIGNALLDAAEETARAIGLDRVSLICFEANRDALRLYLRRGFDVIDRRPIVAHPTLHYSEGDALLMQMPLAA